MSYLFSFFPFPGEPLVVEFGEIFFANCSAFLLRFAILVDFFVGDLGCLAVDLVFFFGVEETGRLLSRL